MTNEATTTDARRIESPRNRGVAVAALILSILPAIVAAIGVAIASATPGMGALGVAFFALLLVVATGAIALVVCIVSVITSRPRTFPVVGLTVLGVTAIVILFAVFPPSVWGA